MSPGIKVVVERALRRETTRKLSPLGTCSLGYTTRRLRMMSYGYHWHSDAGQQGGLPKKGWSLRRCVLGGGREGRGGKEVIWVSAWCVGLDVESHSLEPDYPLLLC